MGKTVHIAAFGPEKIKDSDFRHILRPLLRMYGCDKLVILVPGTRYDDEFIYKFERSDILSAIRDSIEFDLRPVMMNDFDDVFRKTVKMIRRHHPKFSKIYINLSDAPRIAMIAMISAAYFVPGLRNVKLLYSTSEKEVIKGTERMGIGDRTRYKMFAASPVQDLSDDSTVNLEVPVFPTKDISDIDKDIMKVLYDLDGVDSIKELINGLSESTDKEIKRSSLQYRLKKLQDMGMIERDSETRKVMLSLTATGEMFVGGESV